MRLIAIDPGPEQSAAVEYDTERSMPVWFKKCPNGDLRFWLAEETYADVAAIEMIASYGMAVGAETFETCVWIGRFIEAWLSGQHYRAGERPAPSMVYRREVKSHLCGNQRAKDANIRQALIDRYGPGKERAVGRKATPGPLYGITGDCWSALAVAVTAAETRLLEAAA